MLARYGTNSAVLVLGVVALIFLFLTHWVLFVIFALLTLGGLFVRNVRRSTGR
jgi:hypothetical protein